MSKARSKKKRRSEKRASFSVNTKNFAFVECPIGGLYKFEKGKIKNGMYLFDSIDFLVLDINHECFEIKGLRFDVDEGWYDPNADVPKYYGKDVCDACMEYAVDRAIRDHLYLGLALLGQKRPVEFTLRLSHSDIVEMMKEKTGQSILLIDEKRNMKVA